MIWECPDVFAIGDTVVVVVSVSDGAPQCAMWMTGQVASHKFTPHATGQCDSARRYYAPQSLMLTDGRRVAIGWLQATGLHEALTARADALHLALVFGVSQTTASKYTIIACDLLADQPKHDLGQQDVRLTHLAVREVPGSGAGEELLAWAGIDADHIAAAARKLVSG